MKNILRIQSKSDSTKVAGILLNDNNTEINKEIELHCVGAGAVNQAAKAIAIARGFVGPAGINLICIPAFIELKIENEDRSGLKFIIKEEK